MNFHHSSSDETEKQKEELNQDTQRTNGPTVASDGSYEIVFGADKDDSTSYTANGFNAYGFSANGSGEYGSHNMKNDDSRKDRKNHRSRKASKTSTASAVMLTLSVILLVISIVISIVTFTALRHHEALPSIGAKSTATSLDKPWINPADIESDDIYANATAKVIDSVTIITTANSSGSGVVWASNESCAYIVTCHHVIEGATEIQITLNNGKSYPAEVVGSDSRTDISVLRINAANVPSVVLPNEAYEPSLGQSVIAIGNPLGSLGNSVSNGILSSLSRTVSIEGTTMELFQTNAAVNHGNSGGGLFDMNGQLIGLVNAKVAENTVEGIGFAIPYRTLEEIAAELIEQGFVSGRPQIGISTVTINSQDTYLAAIEQYPDLASYATRSGLFQAYYLPGVYVVDASGVKGYAEGSETLQFGDRLAAIGTEMITSGSDITTALHQCSAGDSVQITVYRMDKTVVIELILGEMGQ